jgi:hypothetical protein
MKSYRQKLAIWVNKKILETTDKQVLEILNEVKIQIKNMEREEEDMVNRTYDRGYMDGAEKRNRQSNYYKTFYKINDALKDLLK